MCAKSLSCVRLFETPWTVAHQGPLSVEFSRQEHWSGLPFPPPGDRPDPGIEPQSPASPALQADSLPLSHLGSNRYMLPRARANTRPTCSTCGGWQATPSEWWAWEVLQVCRGLWGSLFRVRELLWEGRLLPIPAPQPWPPEPVSNWTCPDSTVLWLKTIQDCGHKTSCGSELRKWWHWSLGKPESW